MAISGLLSFLVLFAAGIDLDAGTWTKKLDKQGITVFTRTPENSKIKAFKAETTFEDARMESVKSVLKDVEGYTGWISDVKSVRLLEKTVEDGLIYQIVLKVPFPFEKRDVVQQMQIIEDSEEGMRFELSNRPQFIEPSEDAVRMPSADGYWEVQSQDNGDIRVQFEYHSDPGGSLPPWLVNMFIVQSPYRTLKNLRDLVSG